MITHWQWHPELGHVKGKGKFRSRKARWWTRLAQCTSDRLTFSLCRPPPHALFLLAEWTKVPDCWEITSCFYCICISRHQTFKIKCVCARLDYAYMCWRAWTQVDKWTGCTHGQNQDSANILTLDRLRPHSKRVLRTTATDLAQGSSLCVCVSTGTRVFSCVSECMWS